jgi:DNA mismatch endonuclease (patch repair protein)
MPDNLKPEDRIKTMRAVKAKNTGLERTVASMLAGMGLPGWRKHVRTLPGNPDIVFENHRLALFVDGCFWHGCTVCNRPLPKTNPEYWTRKIENNVRRAAKAKEELEQAGWVVLRIWEHELKDSASKSAVRFRIRQALKEVS